MIYQQLTEDLKQAMKSSADFDLGILRMLITSLHNKEIEKKGKGQDENLSDDEVIEILSREAKKRKEAAEIYTKGNRNDLAEKELKETEFIKKYLPEQLGEAQIEKIVKSAIKKTGVTSVKDFGLVMKEVMKDLSAGGGSASGGKGKADAGAVSEIVKKILDN